MRSQDLAFQAMETNLNVIPVLFHTYKDGDGKLIGDLTIDGASVDRSVAMMTGSKGINSMHMDSLRVAPATILW